MLVGDNFYEQFTAANIQPFMTKGSMAARAAAAARNLKVEEESHESNTVSSGNQLSLIP
jgi:hypothetical protein